MAKVNGIDFEEYGAKQLTVDVQPPTIVTNYEWITRALKPTEFETTVQMGHLKIAVYFKGNNRNDIIRAASKFMSNFTRSCELELDGYQGIYKGFITDDNYKKTIARNRYTMNLEFDGYFIDDEQEIIFDGETEGVLSVTGTRETPCIVEIYAKNSLNNYVISGFGDDDIIIETLESGKTAVIDGNKGLITVDGENAFNIVDLWEFPKLAAGETVLTFSSVQAKVSIRYMPIWI